MANAGNASVQLIPGKSLKKKPSLIKSRAFSNEKTRRGKVIFNIQAIRFLRQKNEEVMPPMYLKFRMVTHFKQCWKAIRTGEISSSESFLYKIGHDARRGNCWTLYAWAWHPAHGTGTPEVALPVPRMSFSPSTQLIHTKVDFYREAIEGTDARSISQGDWLSGSFDIITLVSVGTLFVPCDQGSYQKECLKAHWSLEGSVLVVLQKNSGRSCPI